MAFKIHPTLDYLFSLYYLKFHSLYIFIFFSIFFLWIVVFGGHFCQTVIFLIVIFFKQSFFWVKLPLILKV
jgi:hypothetical protein